MNYTYGYLREAVLAHLDIDEEEAQAMHLLERLHIFANEAMQAICSNKPMYQYIDITVVEDYAPLVMDGAFLRLATEEEINWDVEEQGLLPVAFASEDITKDYYHKLGIYKKLETLSMTENFIAFADKKCLKISEYKPTMEELMEAEAFESKAYELAKKKKCMIKEEAIPEYHFSYLGRNSIKFYKTGHYLIPAKYLWFRFDSGISDDTEIDMPADIFMCIPLYIAASCLQIDNMQKAQIKRSEFELALGRCTSTDFMPLNEFKYDWR